MESVQSHKAGGIADAPAVRSAGALGLLGAAVVMVHTAPVGVQYRPVRRCTPVEQPKHLHTT